jgi:hypothetical protein
MISIMTLSLLTYFTYIFIDIIFYVLEGHVMVFWNLLDGGSSHSGPLLRPSESLRGDTSGTDPCHGAGSGVSIGAGTGTPSAACNA